MNPSEVKSLCHSEVGKAEAALVIANGVTEVELLGSSKSEAIGVEVGAQLALSKTREPVCWVPLVVLSSSLFSWDFNKENAPHSQNHINCKEQEYHPEAQTLHIVILPEQDWVVVRNKNERSYPEREDRREKQNKHEREERRKVYNKSIHVVDCFWDVSQGESHGKYEDSFASGGSAHKEAGKVAEKQRQFKEFVEKKQTKGGAVTKTGANYGELWEVDEKEQVNSKSQNESEGEGLLAELEFDNYNGDDWSDSFSQVFNRKEVLHRRVTHSEILVEPKHHDETHNSNWYPKL